MTSNNYKKIFHLVFSYFLIFLPFAAIMIFGYASSDPLEYRFYQSDCFFGKKFLVMVQKTKCGQSCAAVFYKQFFIGIVWGIFSADVVGLKM